MSALGGEPGRELKQDAAELAGGDERRQRLRLHLPDQLIHLLRDVTQIDAALLRDGGRQLLLDHSRESIDNDGMMREQPGLDIEEEAGRSSFHPEMALRSEGRA